MKSRSTSFEHSSFPNLSEQLSKPLEKPRELISQLLYQEGIHSIYSPGGMGKTIFALAAGLEVVRQGGYVLYVDEENGWEHVTFLLRSLGATPRDGEYFGYADAPGFTRQDAEKWTRTVRKQTPSLVIFDSFADLLAADGLGENTSTDVTIWIKRFAQPVKDCGGAALILDHVAKDENTTGARGSTAKRNKVDVAWKLSRKSEFDMSTTGKIALTRDKDRKGTMPYSLEYEIGGDGTGNLTCKRMGVSELPQRKLLNDSEWTAYAALQRFDTGARSKEWHSASQLVESTFYRVRKTLLEEKYVRYDKETNLYSMVPDEENLFSEVPI